MLSERFYQGVRILTWKHTAIEYSPSTIPTRITFYYHNTNPLQITRNSAIKMSNHTLKTADKPNLGNVVVIGGCGFLGHHVVNLLIERYDTNSITVIDLHTTRNRRPESDGVLYVDVDITDAQHLTSVMRTTRPDVVIHTASPPAQADINVSHSLFKNVNVNGTRCVIEACQKAGAKALVYTSSASVVSDNKSDLINADERWPVLQSSMQTEYYARTKVQISIIPYFIVFCTYSTRPKPKTSFSQLTDKTRMIYLQLQFAHLVSLVKGIQW